MALEVNKKIFRYKAKLVIFAFALLCVLALLFTIFFDKAIVSLNSIKQIKSIFQTKINEPENEMSFTDGDFKLELDQSGKLIKVKAKIAQNESTVFDVLGVKPYKMKDFAGEAKRFPELPEYGKIAYLLRQTSFPLQKLGQNSRAT
jgi:hypothetical protein